MNATRNIKLVITAPIYSLLLALICFASCDKKEKQDETRESKPDRVKYLKQLIQKIGFQELPYTYDLAKRVIDSKYQVDQNTNDTLFFAAGSFGGVLPDTSKFYSVLTYQAGDSLYPFLTVIDRQGNVIDVQNIGIGHCRGLIIDIDSCVDLVKIDKDLKIELLYKMRGTAAIDSTNQEVKVCNTIIGNGKITDAGKIEIKKSDLIVCD